MRLINNLRCASSAIALLYGAVALPAQAQTAPDAADPAVQEQAGDEAADQVAEIVVTGSRISRRDYSAVSSVVTTDAEVLERSGQVTIEGALNSLPQMGVGTGSTTQQNRTGRASINLRGLGEPRSLVLLDGRRIQPGAPSGAADLNILPSVLIQSIETVTGGASAAYGSDAMAGVVNIRLMPDFSGILTSAQYSAPEHGRGSSQEYTLVIGDDFANGDGNAFLALSYAEREQLQRKDRDFFRTSILNSRIARVITSLGSNAPSQSVVDSVFGGYGAAPGSVSRTTALSFNDDGTLFTPSPGVGQDIVNYRGGFDDITILQDNALAYNQGYTYELVAPLSRISAFSRATRTLNDDIEWFAEGLFTSYEVSSGGAPASIGTSGTTATVPVTNPFIPADMRRLLDSRPNPLAPIAITYRFDQMGVSTVTTDHTIYQLTTGLKGQLDFRDWGWNVYASHGSTKEEAVATNRFSLRPVQQLLDAPDGGASLCAGGLNLFGAAADVSPDCLEYIRYDSTNLSEISQTMAEATLQGALFTVPAGDVRFAAGVNWRREHYEVVVDEEVAAGFIPGDLSGPSTSGGRDVSEAFGELLIPLLADVPFVKLLEADVGYRVSDYSGSGTVESYTGNLTWAVNDVVSLRGGYSRAIRAPSLENLYASAIQATLRIGSPSATSTGGDPCDVRSSFRLGPDGPDLRSLCQALGVPASAIDSYTSITQSIFGQTTGNPDLSNEYADTFTAGLILQAPASAPTLFSQLRGSIDLFDIEISDAIGQLPLATALARCYNLDGVSNTSYDPNNSNCAFFPRDVNTGQIERLEVPLLNLSRYRTRGVDVQADWRFDLEDIGLPSSFGGFEVNMVGTYLDMFEIQELSNTEPLDYAGYSQSPIDPNGRSSVLPRWKSVTTFTHVLGDFETSLIWRYVSAIEDVSRVANPSSTTEGADAYSYFDASVRWNFSEKASLRVGVNNIADTEPPIISETMGNTDTQTYDVLGRTFYVSLKSTF